jgi:cellulose synthase/poly-beta-1,6-N-acetylglucosamine synthase-like glycosyltransferase
LAEAARIMSPQAEFVLVLDADFVPPPNLIKQFLQVLSPPANENAGAPSAEKIGAVQGYQWHIINARENWITKGIRCEFSGSYLVEREAQERFGGLKAIAGSVFMIRAEVLRQLGWGTSITEDWELTLRLYLAGYKVRFMPLLKAPGECIATLRQLIRQRIRWAEGHTFNVKRFFLAILKSGRISFGEKLEFFYYAAYYLKDTFYLIGSAAWLLAALFSRHSIPAEAVFLGWSLLICNAFALPMMSLTGLLLEGDARRYTSGVFSQVILTHLLVPFQAYASLKGLLEKSEGAWHRTFKSGRITEVFAVWQRHRIREAVK